MSIQEEAELFLKKFMDPIHMDMSMSATLRWVYRKSAAKANAITALEYLIEESLELLRDEKWRAMKVLIEKM